MTMIKSRKIRPFKHRFQKSQRNCIMVSKDNCDLIFFLFLSNKSVDLIDTRAQYFFLTEGQHTVLDCRYLNNVEWPYSFRWICWSSIQILVSNISCREYFNKHQSCRCFQVTLWQNLCLLKRWSGYRIFYIYVFSWSWWICLWSKLMAKY